MLDVFESEPLPDSDPLWTRSDVYITSHTAAPTRAEAVVELFADNYRRYIAGEPLLYGIDLDRGY